MSESAAKLAYSIEETCRALSIGRTSLYRLIKDGEVKTRKIGARVLIPASELQRLIGG